MISTGPMAFHPSVTAPAQPRQEIGWIAAAAMQSEPVGEIRNSIASNRNRSLARPAGPSITGMNVGKTPPRGREGPLCDCRG